MGDFYISVIIPTYNRANDLDRCLKSLLSQTYKNFEVLVCDDGSTDNTEGIVEKYNSILKINYIKDENFGGPAKPRNNGILEAKGDWICFLDSDDWWYANKLQESLVYMNDYDLIHHDLDIYINTEKKGTAKGRVLNNNIVTDLIVNGNGIINSSVVIRKSIVETVGKITEDKSLIAVEDYDYWIRVAKVTNRIKYLEISLGGYWVGENISYSVKQIDRAKCLLNKYIQELTPEEQKSAILIHNFTSARMYHYLSMFAEARDLYLESLSKDNLKRSLKAMIGFLMCNFKIK